MNGSPILYIHFVTNSDKIYIAPNHRIEPNATVITYHHIADNGGIGSDETVSPKLRMFVFDGKNNRHYLITMKN